MSGAGTDRVQACLDGLARGEPLWVGRTITSVLRGGDEGERLEVACRELRRGAGPGHRIGITGAPGVGKSTLVAALAREIRGTGDTVGAVASDPGSPYSGGAFLGDRVRLAGFRMADDAGVFFRSLALRDTGGVGQEAVRVAEVLEAAGYPWIFLETVGAGQAEVAIKDHVDSVVVVVSPDQGDEMQLLKAGLLEIADIFVVSHAERDGAERFCHLLRERAHFKARGWSPRVVATEALRGRGIPEVLTALREHREHVRSAQGKE